MNKLTLPNLSNKPNARQSYNINGMEYMFHFEWCGTFCLLDIYLIENNLNNYLVKGRGLTLSSNLIERVKDSDIITGSLVLINKYGLTTEPSQDNLHSDYYLLYTEEE